MSVQISFEALAISDDSLTALSKVWQQLEEQASQSIFTSWDWIGTWLKQVTESVFLLKAEKNNQVVGLGCFVAQTASRYHLPSIKQLFLHKVGKPASDQIWIEYNDLLVQNQDADEIRKSMYGYLAQCATWHWQELHLDMIKPESVAEKLLPTSIACRETMRDIGYRQTLANPEQMLAARTKNTRQQIKRSIKLLSEQGKLNLFSFDVPSEKLNCFQDMARLHKDQWQDSQWGSGFNNPMFVEFHQAMLDKECTRILALKIDNRALAYGYYFTYGDTVYFYLSAMTKDRDNRVKIGLVLHTLAMEYFHSQGYKYYDFLAGEARYKASLSDQTYPLVSICLFRHSWILALEQQLRKIKKIIKR